MKKLALILIGALTLTGCAQASEPSATDPAASESPAEVFPTPAIADNNVPKTCELPGLQALVGEITGGEVSTDPNPVNRQNSNAENYQAYLDGLYLVCIYTVSGTNSAAYIFWREGDETSWRDSLASANEDLEAGELPFEETSLGLGEATAFYVFESEENGGFFNAHTFINETSIVVFTNVAKDLETGKRFLAEAINSMP